MLRSGIVRNPLTLFEIAGIIDERFCAGQILTADHQPAPLLFGSQRGTLADMVELADTLDLGSSGFTVWVQIPLSAPYLR